MIHNITKACNKVGTKEELIEFLKGYKKILSNAMLDYLNSLIEL